MKSISIPLELIDLEGDGCHLLVDVVAFDHLYKAVLDTGASKTAFDKGTLEQFMQPGDLILSDKFSAGLGVTSMESHTLILPSLKIGKFEIFTPEIAVLDLSTIRSAYESLGLPPLIGVIGGDILVAYQAEINYKKLTLKLFPHN